MTEKLLLERFAYTPLGTFGRLILPEFFAWTVERPWLGNAPRESCIPEGEYDLVETIFHRGGYKTWEILGVPNRTLIKIHKANTMHDLLGCIAPGKRLGVIDPPGDPEMTWAVISSGEAFAELMVAMGREKPPRILITHRIGDGIL